MERIITERLIDADILGSNFSHIMEEMNPDVLAGLFSDELYLNDCKLCTQKNSRPCDRKCYEHVREWLDLPFDEEGKKLIKAFKAWEEINE